ncbi:MAG: energy-coupling factor transporter transmembrane component T [Candidatus Cloacimonadota bacterium]|nr:energy-coupling factor transporter transmembrane component T [Candidatus Cloacimonadota bacterium]
MKINLRTLLIIVILITSLSIIYQTVEVQVSLIIFSVILLFLINPSKSRFQRLAHRLKRIALPIAVLMIFQILFRRQGEVLWQWNFIKVTSVGLEYGIASSLRFFLLILIAGLLLDLPYFDYLMAFRGWKFPEKLTFLLASAIHFLHIFKKQFSQIQEALKLRGIILSDLPLRNRVSAFLSLLFPVVGSTLTEIRYRAISLDLRGFGLYKKRTFLHKHKLKLVDYIIQISCLMIFVLFIFHNIF